MKEEKKLLVYAQPCCEAYELQTEGVVCASGETDPYQYGEGGGL